MFFSPSGTRKWMLYSLWVSDLPSDNLYLIVMNIPPLPKGNASRFMVDSPLLILDYWKAIFTQPPMRSHSLVFDSFWALLYRGFKPQNDWPCNPQNWLVKNTWRWWTYGSFFWVEIIPSIAKQWNKLMIVVLDKKALGPNDLYRCCPDIQLIHQGPKTQLISSLFLGKSWSPPGCMRLTAKCSETFGETNIASGSSPSKRKLVFEPLVFRDYVLVSGRVKYQNSTG